jgi:hypothetical protein
VIVDTVLNENMRPVFVDEPSEVHRRLHHPYSETWVKVLIGETGQLVTIPEYLYKDTLKMVVKTLHEMASKKDLGTYQRNPERWEDLVNRTAVQLIKRIRDEK